MQRLTWVAITVSLSIIFPPFASAQSNFPPKELLDSITGQGIRAHMEFLALRFLAKTKNLASGRAAEKLFPQDLVLPLKMAFGAIE